MAGAPARAPPVTAVAAVRLVLVSAALALAWLMGPAGAAERTDGTGFTQGRLGLRAYRLYVPVAADPAPLPLVVALHGCWQTPEDFARGTRLNEAAERRRLLVLYPAQSQRDNSMRCWNWFEPAQADGEVTQLLELIRHVMDGQRVAPDRVAVLGFSSGGYMAVNLVCAAPDVIASGVGVVAGGPYRCATGALGAVDCMRGQGISGEASAAACRARMGPRARPIRASIWHGEADSMVSPANTDALVEMFRRLDGLPAAPAERSDGGAHAVWRGAGGRVMLERRLVPGMGHAWSGGDVRGTHTFPRGPDATERILDFLLGAPAGP